MDADIDWDIVNADWEVASDITGEVNITCPVSLIFNKSTGELFCKRSVLVAEVVPPPTTLSLADESVLDPIIKLRVL